MFSARNVVRSAPRAVSRLSGPALRQTARPSAFTKAASALRPAQAAFSTTSVRKATENDGELSAKLESEIKIEEDIKASEQDPASIKDFLNNSAFELIDTPGQEIVKLVRDFGDEKSVLVPPHWFQQQANNAIAGSPSASPLPISPTTTPTARRAHSRTRVLRMRAPRAASATLAPTRKSMRNSRRMLRRRATPLSTYQLSSRSLARPLEL
jgi:hypothetical protein